MQSRAPYYLFFFCNATAFVGLRSPSVEVYTSHTLDTYIQTHTHTHTHTHTQAHTQAHTPVRTSLV